VLHICVYERRSIFADSRIGEIELPLEKLSDEEPISEWLPLNCDRGQAWFIHTRVSLRFVLMALKTQVRIESVRTRSTTSSSTSHTNVVEKVRESQIREHQENIESAMNEVDMYLHDDWKSENMIQGLRLRINN